MIQMTVDGYKCTRCDTDLTGSGIGLMCGAQSRIRDYTTQCFVLCPRCAEPFQETVRAAHPQRMWLGDRPILSACCLAPANFEGDDMICHKCRVRRPL